MKTKYIVRFLLAAAAISALAFAIAAQKDAPRRADTQVFMRGKLVYSQAVLEGLALEKFDLVSKNTIRLRNMTQSNQWFICKQPDYVKHTASYQKNADALYMAAVEKNLDACTEAFVKVTRNCVDCHRIVRAEQRRQAMESTIGK